jgi:NADPH-dependent curcumin reductase CurA
LIVVKRLIMQGFIVMDYMAERDAALADLQAWVASGKLKVQEGRERAISTRRPCESRDP